MKNRRKVGLEDRLSQADIKARGALDVFEQAALDLEAAAEAADRVLIEAEAEVQRLTALRDEAFRQSAAHMTKADRIREFSK